MGNLDRRLSVGAVRLPVSVAIAAVGLLALLMIWQARSGVAVSEESTSPAAGRIEVQEGVIVQTLPLPIDYLDRRAREVHRRDTGLNLEDALADVKRTMYEWASPGPLDGKLRMSPGYDVSLQVLAEFGEAAVPAIRRELDHSECVVLRGAMLEVLARIGGEQAATVARTVPLKGLTTGEYRALFRIASSIEESEVRADLTEGLRRHAPARILREFEGNDSKWMRRW